MNLFRLFTMYMTCYSMVPKIAHSIPLKIGLDKDLNNKINLNLEQALNVRTDLSSVVGGLSTADYQFLRDTNLQDLVQIEFNRSNTSPFAAIAALILKPIISQIITSALVDSFDCTDSVDTFSLIEKPRLISTNPIDGVHNYHLIFDSGNQITIDQYHLLDKDLELPDLYSQFYSIDTYADALPVVDLHVAGVKSHALPEGKMSNGGAEIAEKVLTRAKDYILADIFKEANGELSKISHAFKVKDLVSKYITFINTYHDEGFGAAFIELSENEMADKLFSISVNGLNKFLKYCELPSVGLGAVSGIFAFFDPIVTAPRSLDELMAPDPMVDLLFKLYESEMKNNPISIVDSLIVEYPNQPAIRPYP